jgi:hypothetical protein
MPPKGPAGNIGKTKRGVTCNANTACPRRKINTTNSLKSDRSFA